MRGTGEDILIESYPTADDARWWLYAWADRGFYPLPLPGNTETIVNARQVAIAYLKLDSEENIVLNGAVAYPGN